MSVIVEAANDFLLWLKRDRRMAVRRDLVKVNIGCGLRVAEGWFNVDASPNALFAGCPTPILKFVYRFSGARKLCSMRDFVAVLSGHRFLHHNLRYGLPFPDDSIDYAYSSHFLEHLYRDEAASVLQDSLRALRQGGIIRICVPDLEHAVSLYRRGEQDKFLRYFFAGSRQRQFLQHRYMYDFSMLENLLSRTGFVDVNRCSCREGSTPDLTELESPSDETLYVEAAKPRTACGNLREQENPS